MEEMISLNVGGKTFVTTRALLTSVQGSMLAMMFDPSNPIPASRRDQNGAFFIEEDPATFRVILCWLRHRSLNMNLGSGDVSLQYLVASANYFGLAELENEAKKKLKYEEDQARERKGKIGSISNELAEITGNLRRLTDGINAVNEKLVTGVKCQPNVPIKMKHSPGGYLDQL